MTSISWADEVEEDEKFVSPRSRDRAPRMPIFVFAEQPNHTVVFRDVKFGVKQVVEFVTEKHIRRWRAYIPSTNETLFDTGTTHPASERFVEIAKSQVPKSEWEKYALSK